METFKKTLAKKDYWIGDNGTLKSKSFRVMSPTYRQGYYTVILKTDGVQKQRSIHRLVAEAFIPNPENKPMVNHINGIKTDNRVENLEWVTGKENSAHAFLIGANKNIGNNHCKSKLTEHDVLRIRTEASTSGEEFSKIFNVNPKTISDIRLGKTWKHI